MTQAGWRDRARPFVDQDLENLLGFWRFVPELVEEWPEWDDNSRMKLIIQWPIDRERLQRVVDAAEAGYLNERQSRAWQEVQQLIELHRATVEEMLGEPI
jgi:hypothetical protein